MTGTVSQCLIARHHNPGAWQKLIWGKPQWGGLNARGDGESYSGAGKGAMGGGRRLEGESGFGWGRGLGGIWGLMVMIDWIGFC